MARPILAWVALSLPPYEIHLLRRIARELPAIELRALLLRDWNRQRRWPPPPAELVTRHFDGGGEADYRPGAVRHWLQEWRRGQRVLADLVRSGVRALVLAGYHTFTHCRIIAGAGRGGYALFVRGDCNARSAPAHAPPAAWAKRAVLRWVIRRCAGVMPMGRFGQEYFESYGADPRRCFWVPYEPDYDFFAQVLPAELDQLNRRHRLKAERPCVLFCGRLVAAKRPDLALAAFARIAAQRPEWDLLIAGEGPLEPELRGAIPEPLAQRVRLLGHCGDHELRAAYHRADLLVVPSDLEPWALVVSEAMAAGLPVVATDVVGAAHELVIDGENGRIVPTGNLQRLSEALLEATEPERLARYRRGVGPALEAWRRRADPVEGIRRALRSVELL